MKALGGIKPLSDDSKANETAKETNAEAPPRQSERQVATPENTDRYNPVAEIIERHENAVNRLKRGR